MLLLFILTLLLQLSEEHLSYPINYCNMAKTCIHDSRVVCASSPDGCTRRSFLDQCDMYEYNCDYNTQFTESECTENKEELDQQANETDNRQDEKIEYLAGSSEEIVKLDLHKGTEKDSNNVFNMFKSNCGRPLTWATTEKGETRDFFRILTQEK
ncbi:uncharacterized protein LOC125053544 isoform X1 [Pieris napi]|uniref:uncharacterized protein LOC125053544 isoform X1 n=2 Tax=Pieris napi TaxID=78633 RepID=UPI001FB97162|nr:uncharacterized protein LOC125053544 isoform X1 [Pieris napi]